MKAGATPAQFSYNIHVLEPQKSTNFPIPKMGSYIWRKVT